ncbi:hypothetical protein CV103_21340 [Sphingomonas fennica]|uniref:Uncharacterized protein n=1 Tax=Edaphosphingomonas fennica TaxID=114404 RepID=A0A2T4HJ99_9SPHN|nr:hypothetical protein CV103_21340 [Sphingomonas fennica]
MALARGSAIAPTPRKTLLQWIEFDDGDPTGFTHPACSPQAQALHARIVLDPHEARGDPCEPLQPPSGLRLPPLG